MKWQLSFSKSEWEINDVGREERKIPEILMESDTVPLPNAIFA